MRKQIAFVLTSEPFYGVMEASVPGAFTAAQSDVASPTMSREDGQVTQRLAEPDRKSDILSFTIKSVFIMR